MPDCIGYCVLIGGLLGNCSCIALPPASMQSYRETALRTLHNLVQGAEKVVTLKLPGVVQCLWLHLAGERPPIDSGQHQ